jgi:hypothetical protein
VDFIQDYKYRWFEIQDSGRLFPLGGRREQLDANFVAVPEERVNEVVSL